VQNPPKIMPLLNDASKRIQDLLNTKAYRILGTYRVLEDSKKYAADFEAKMAEAFSQGLESLRRAWAEIVEAGRNSVTIV
jgi:hypothetical protein